MELTMRQAVSLAACGGAVVGGLVGALTVKRLLREDYEERVTLEIMEAREFYKNLYAPKPTPEELSGVKTDTSGWAAPVVTEPTMLAEAVDALQEYGNEEATKEGVTVVTNIFNARDEELAVIQDVWDIETEMKHRTEDAPFIISEEEFNVGEKDYEQLAMTYYEEDEVLADDRDQMIPDKDEKVGDHNLAKFGHGSGDPNMLYVRNDVLDVDIAIALSNGSYSREVLGFTHSDKPQSRRRRRGWDDE